MYFAKENQFKLTTISLGHILLRDDGYFILDKCYGENYARDIIYQGEFLDD